MTQLSQKMLPKALKPGEIRKFRLTNAGQLDPLSGEPSFNSGAMLVGITTVWDVEKKENVILKNITGKAIKKDPVSGKDIIEEVISEIQFDATGHVYVDHTQPETYIFLSRDNRNGTNPFRDKNTPIMWEELLIDNNKEKAKFNSDMKFEALTIVKKGDIKAVIAIGEILSKKRLISVNLNGNPSDIRWAIEQICDTQAAEVIRASKEKLPKIKLDIQDAANFGEIEYNPDGNTWVFAKEYGDNKEILKVQPGYDPIDALANYLLSEEEEMKKAKVEDRKPTKLQRIKDTLQEASVGAN